MIDDSELERLLNDIESDRVERKASASDTGEIRKAICAFANDMPGHNQPGVVLIGVKNDGSSAQLKVTDELLRQLADMRSDGNVLPLPTMTVQKKNLSGCEMAVIVVEPSLYPPVRYNGRIWIRVGPRRATASAEEERRLNERRRTRDLVWDLHPVSAASIDELDLDLFERTYLPAAVPSDILEQNERTIEQHLSRCGFSIPAIPLCQQLSDSWQWERRPPISCLGPMSNSSVSMERIFPSPSSIKKTATGPYLNS